MASDERLLPNRVVSKKWNVPAPLSRYSLSKSRSNPKPNSLDTAVPRPYAVPPSGTPPLRFAAASVTRWPFSVRPCSAKLDRAPSPKSPSRPAIFGAFNAAGFAVPSGLGAALGDAAGLGDTRCAFAQTGSSVKASAASAPWRPSRAMSPPLVPRSWVRRSEVGRRHLRVRCPCSRGRNATRRRTTTRRRCSTSRTRDRGPRS